METQTPPYVSNVIRTPDGTILRSRHTHDHQTYTDLNGLEYMVDGGLYYLRRNVHDVEPYEELSVASTEPFERIREAIEWGSYGKSGKEKLRYAKLSEMTDDHIQKVIELINKGLVVSQERQRFETPSMNMRGDLREAAGLDKSQEPIVLERPDRWLIPYFEQELAYRKEHGISLLDPEPVQ